MSNEQKKMQLLELADRMLRSWWTVVAGVSLGLAGAMAALHYTPRIYEASTSIFVAPQQIPREFVRATVIDDIGLRMAALKDAVLSRPYMLKLIEEVYVPPGRGDVEVDRLIGMVGSRVTVRVERGVFKISFRDQNAVRAAKVANFLADLYIEENARYRVLRAGDTTRTLQEIAARVKKDLDAMESDIAKFKSAHPYETGEERDVNMRMLELRQHELEEKGKSLAMSRERLRALSEWATDEEWLSGLSSLGGASASSAQVVQLEQQLDEARLKYGDKHPVVKALLRQIEDAGATAELDTAQLRGTGTISQHDIVMGRRDDPVEDQRPVLEREIAAIEEEIEGIKKELAVYEKRLVNTPIVEQKLDELEKDHGVLLKQYRDYSTRVEEAKSAEMMEEGRKGEQFEVIDKAVPPRLPVRPVASIVLAVGLAVGLLVFVGPLVVRELSQPLVRSAAGLVAFGDVPVLASIPRIHTSEALRAARLRMTKNVGLSVTSMAVLTAVVLFLG